MSQTNDIAEKINELTKNIAREPSNQNYYYKRAKLFLDDTQIGEAFKDFRKVIDIDAESSQGKSAKEKVTIFYNFFIEEDTKSLKREPKNAELYSSRANCYYTIKKYREAINDFKKLLELNPDNEDAIWTIGRCYFALGNYEEAHEYYEKYIEATKHFVIDDETARHFVQIGEYYENKKEYNKAINVYDRLMYLNMEVAFEEFALDRIKELYDTQKADLDESHKNKMLEMQLKQQEKIAKARLDERNKIIADLSHHIKNLISTVIDPLENLQEDNRVKPQVIQNALRGANLVREIVNAMNLSFKGSIQDFFHDAKNNKTEDATDFRAIIIESLKHSISKMFDGKYFGNFVRKYFPSKAVFLEAKSQWTRLSQNDELHELTPFLKKYFFKIDIALDHADKHVLGNEKGSAMKLLILFQELILNAVKYSAFVNKEQRLIQITLASNAKQVSIKVENRFKANVKTRTSGIGHVIIENFAKLLSTKPIINKNGDIYAVEIQFANLWEAQTE